MAKNTTSRKPCANLRGLLLLSGNLGRLRGGGGADNGLGGNGEHVRKVVFGVTCVWVGAGMSTSFLALA